MARMFYQKPKVGEWFVTTYGSGTVTVSQKSAGKAPHYGITGTLHDPGNDELRQQMSHELADWLNGDDAPLTWLEGAVHLKADALGLRCGRKVEARGPHDESRPGRGDWKTRDDLESITERAAMILRLFAKAEAG